MAGRRAVLAFACAAFGALAPVAARAVTMPMTDAGVHGRGSMRIGGGVRFLSLSGSYREMGEQYGALMKDQLAPLLDQDASSLTPHERGRLEQGISRRYLELLRGVAAGLEVSYDQVLRTAFRLPPPRGAAVLAGVRGTGGRSDLLHARNLDLVARPAGDAQAVVELRPTGELRFLATTVVGLSDGMNERGVSVSVDAGPVCAWSSPARSGVPQASGKVIDILATSTTVKQVDALAHATADDAAIMLVGSAAERKGMVFDLACGTVRRTRLRGTGPLIASQAYLHAELTSPGDPHPRQVALEGLLAQSAMANPGDLATVLADAGGEYAPNNGTTRKSVIYDGRSRTLRLALGDNHAAWGRWIEYDWANDQATALRPAPFDVSTVTLVTRSAEFAASIRVQVADPAEAWSLFAEIGGALRAAGLEDPVNPYTIQHGKVGDLFDVEAVQPVSGLAAAAGRVRFTARDPILIAQVRHRGPPDTWDRARIVLDTWMEENGYALAGPPREVYMNGFWDRRERSAWQTDFELPVAARERAPGHDRGRDITAPAPASTVLPP